MEERGTMGEIKSLVLVISGGRCEVVRQGYVKKGIYLFFFKVEMFQHVGERCVRESRECWMFCGDSVLC